jgi:predicted PurR-regulated permease PerM
MSESLKTTKNVISTASIIAICVLVCFYLIFLLLDLHRIFFIKNKVSIKTQKWNHRILHQNYNLRNKKNNSKRITYLDYIE